MNDRLQGSCYHNAIWYKNYRIYLSDLYETHGYQYQFVHDDFDGADDACDNRCGEAATVTEAMAMIDEKENAWSNDRE